MLLLCFLYSGVTPSRNAERSSRSYVHQFTINVNKHGFSTFPLMTIWLPRQRSTLRLISSTRPIFTRHANSRSFLQRSLATQTNPEKLSTTPTLKENPPPAPLQTRIWKKVKHEAQHYWHGSKLLVSDVRIASKLQWKILHGDTLTRRERRQVSVTRIVK